jgi:GT2 family glycosyltransferase/glycosyltransferase involved in cell wall biosynthesis
LVQNGKVSVIVPTRGKPRLVQNCLTALFRAAGKVPLEVVVMEQGGDECSAFLAIDFADKPVVRLVSEEGWSFSEINNAGALATDGEFLLLLNNDTIPKPGFLQAMVDETADPTVGIVGSKLLFPNRTIQHIGVGLRQDGVPYHIGYGKADDGTFEPANRTDEYPAVTFACALIRRTVWDALGGLDPIYFFNYEDTDFCLRALEAGHRSVMAHRSVVIHLEGQSQESRGTEKHSRNRNLGIFGERWVATKDEDGSCRMERATGLRLMRQAGTFRSDRRNIAFIPGGRKAGVPWWRIELPARKLAKLGLANIQLLYGDMEEGKLRDALQAADIAVFQGFATDWIVKIAGMGGLRNWPLIYDYDDHPVHMSPFSQAFRTFGCQEIKLQQKRDGKEFWLWRDGENGFDLKRNRENRNNQLMAFHLADLVTTTTLPLHAYFKTLNENVTVLPNAIDFDLFRHPFTLFERRPGPIRIGWHGGDNHFHDIASIAKELVAYVNNHDVQLVLFGAFYRGPLAGIDESKVVEEEWVDVEAFPFKLAALGVDVAIIPLADERQPHMRFNEFKSELKFLEYSAMRVPALVTGLAAAYGVCSDGDNALTYATGEEFTEKLHQLCTDADLRLRLGTAALDWVHEHRDLEKLAPRWLQIYEQAIDQFAEKRQAAADEIEAAETEAASNVVDFPAPTADAADLADAIDGAIQDADLDPAASNAVADGT